MRNGIRIVDADAHVREPDSELKSRLPEPHRNRPMLFPVENFDRSFGGTLGKGFVPPAEYLADLDVEGIDTAIIYPTLGLFLGEVREAALAISLTRAYNDWISSFCSANPDRLKAVALLQVLDIDAACAELERAVSKLGLLAGMVPAYNRFGPRNLGERALDPLYGTAQQLGVPIAIHADGGLTPINERFGTFAEIHTFSHVPEQMAAVTATVLGGVFERFPSLRVGFMEAGCGWVPFWIQHMDEEVELRHSEVPWLRAKPSEYVKSGRAFFGVEPEEHLISIVADVVGDGSLLYASDYPHWDSDWPNTTKTLLNRDDVSDGLKRKVLGENALAFYGLPGADL